MMEVLKELRVYRDEVLETIQCPHKWYEYLYWVHVSYGDPNVKLEIDYVMKALDKIDKEMEKTKDAKLLADFAALRKEFEEIKEKVDLS